MVSNKRLNREWHNISCILVMISYNNHNITQISYNNHSIKYVYGCDGNLVWSGDTPTPPVPTGGTKFYATYNDLTTYSAACDGSSDITSATTHPNGYWSEYMLYGEIGNCITSIENCTFQNLVRLTGCTIPTSVTNIGYQAFDSCISLVSIVIPESVTNIESEAFCDCRSLISANIPSGITEIKHDLFDGCHSLTGITLHSGIIYIDDYAFRNCSGMTSIVIPENVIQIGQEAFYGCTRLQSIIVEATTPPNIGNGALKTFDNTGSCPILVPAQSIEAYKSDVGWATYSSRLQPII